MPASLLLAFAGGVVGCVAPTTPHLSPLRVEATRRVREKQKEKDFKEENMTFTKFVFDISLTFSMIGILIIGITLAELPQFEALVEVMSIIGYPLLAFVVCTALTGLSLRYTKQEWFGYVRAVLLLVGGLTTLTFGVVVGVDLMHKTPSEFFLNNLSVFGFGVVMLLTCWLCRRWNASCVPQLKAMFSI